MSKTEDLSSKLRTANYDYERIRSMYTAASDRALNAEKEASLHKSRLAYVLFSSNSAHVKVVTKPQLIHNQPVLLHVRYSKQRLPIDRPATSSNERRTRLPECARRTKPSSVRKRKTSKNSPKDGSASLILRASWPRQQADCTLPTAMSSMGQNS